MRTILQASRPADWRVTLASAALATVVLAARSADATIVIACNAADVYAQAPLCPVSADPCIIDDFVICGSSCGGSCTYDFGTTKTLRLTTNSGSFINATGFPSDITVLAGHINTSGETTVRFDAGGGGKSLIVRALTGSVNLGTGMMRNTGPVAGNMVYSQSFVSVTVGAVDARATGAGQIGGAIVFGSPGYVNVIGTLDASGPAGGGFVFLQGYQVYLQDDLFSNTTTSGTGGWVQLVSVDGPGGAPYLYVNGQIHASVTGAGSTADGGTVFIGRTGGETGGYLQKPSVVVYEPINAGAIAGDAGSIEIEGSTLTLVDAGVTLDAAAASTPGSKGGKVTVTTHSTTSTPTFRLIDARGHTGGVVKIRLAGGAVFDKDVRVDSNQGPNGKGGSISIRTKEDDGVAGCWDCREPGDPCACGVPSSCTQKIQINEDLIANGNGTSGDGGTITLEAPYVYMRAVGTGARRLIVNANTGTDATTGDQPGLIRVRARDSQFRVRTDAGLNHKVRALPNRPGITEICITQPLGGDYNPMFVLCGPGYAPQCNPG